MLKVFTTCLFETKTRTSASLHKKTEWRNMTSLVINYNNVLLGLAKLSYSILKASVLSSVLETSITKQLGSRSDSDLQSLPL